MIERRYITDRNQWLEWRKADLTASDVGAVAGVDPYRSPLSVFTDKLGLTTTVQTALMQRGHWLEAAAHEAIVDSYPGRRIINPKVYLRDPSIRLGATPDRLAEDEDQSGLINIQIKAVSRPAFERWEGRPPMSYMLQTLAEGLLTDARTSELAVLVISTYEAELKVFEVRRHAAAEQRIRQLAVDFWRDMEAGRMPRPQFERDSDVVSALFSVAKAGPPLDLSASNRIREVIEQRHIIKARMKADAETVAALETEIKYEMGESETAALPGWRLSWKEQTRRAYEVPESTMRVLRITQDADSANQNDDAGLSQNANRIRRTPND